MRKGEYKTNGFILKFLKFNFTCGFLLFLINIIGSRGKIDE